MRVIQITPEIGAFAVVNGEIQPIDATVWLNLDFAVSVSPITGTGEFAEYQGCPCVLINGGTPEPMILGFPGFTTEQLASYVFGHWSTMYPAGESEPF